MTPRDPKRIYSSMEEALRHLPEDGYVIVSHGLNGEVRILRDTRTPEDHRATLRRHRRACAMARRPRRRELTPIVHFVRRAHGSSGRPRAQASRPSARSGDSGPDGSGPAGDEPWRAPLALAPPPPTIYIRRAIAAWPPKPRLAKYAIRDLIERVAS